MKNVFLFCLMASLFVGTNLYAADGDLIVNGMVSIGTTTPTDSLSIKGNCTKALTGTVAVTQGSNSAIGTNTLFGTELVMGQAIKIGSELFHVNGWSGTILLLTPSYQGVSASGLTAYIEPNNLLSLDDGAGQNRIAVTRQGFVGIGTSSPSYALDVAGNIRATSIFGNVSKATSADKLLGDGAYRSAATTNASNAIVRRDASGNFAAGTITANVNGNLNGNVTGNAASANYANYLLGDGDYRQATTANTSNAIVRRDVSGNFAAGTITANVIGNLTGDVTSMAGKTFLEGIGTSDGWYLNKGSYYQITVEVTGAVVGDYCIVSKPASGDNHLDISAWVSASDTVTIEFRNSFGPGYNAMPTRTWPVLVVH
jgi:hypothetical protein